MQKVITEAKFCSEFLGIAYDIKLLLLLKQNSYHIIIPIFVLEDACSYLLVNQETFISELRQT